MFFSVNTATAENVAVTNGLVTEETSSVPSVTTEAVIATAVKEAAVKPLKIEVHATAMHHEQLVPKVAHSQNHEFSHNQAVSELMLNFCNFEIVRGWGKPRTPPGLDRSRIFFEWPNWSAIA